MGAIEEWCTELEDENVAALVADTSAELLRALDPPPGLTLWMDRHGLGIVLVEPEAYYGDQAPTEPIAMEQPDPIRRPEPLATLWDFAVGDYIEYKIGGNNSFSVGRGQIISFRDDGGIMIDVGRDSPVGVYVEMGDKISKVPPT